MNLDFSNLDPNNIGSWPIPLKAIVILIVCAAVLGGSFHFLLKSQLDDLDASVQKEEKLRKELKVKAHKAVNLQLYQAKLEKMKESFGAMLRQLPNKNEVAELLVDISQSGLASGLEFELFKPEAERIKGFYAELPIKIKVAGNYHEFGRFVSNVASLSRIVTVHDYKISSAGEKSSKTLILESTAKTYRYLDEEEQMKASATKKRKKK